MPKISIQFFNAMGAMVCLAALMGSHTGAFAQASPDMKGRARALAQICRADYTRLCANVRPGGGRVLACLQKHEAELSPQCRTALPSADAIRAKAAESGALQR